MRNKKTFAKTIACLLIMVVMVDGLAITTFCATSTQLQQEKDEIERKKQEETAKKKQQQAELDKANKKAGQIEDDLEDVEAEIEEVDANLVETMASVELINTEIAEKEEQIEETTAQYEEAKKNEEDQYEAMKLRIRYMYEKGDETYMQMLIEAQSFSDMMNKVEYVEKLYDYDRRLLEEYKTAKEETNRLKIQLEEEKDELDATLLELKDEEAYLNELLEEKQSQYDDYASMLSQAKAEAAAYRANVEKQNAAIKKLEQESNAKQKEIDKAKKEEEEAARKAAEEAKKAASTASGVAVGKTVSSNGNISNSADNSGSKTYRSASSYTDGSIGERVVNYASQFVGNPYVYGGTSLTRGCDCSGFVYRVYRDFGYNIPRTGMTGIGTAVSYEDARAGDIICYPGHVALYMGNGRIVHASTQKTGIKYGNALYKTILTIRRIT